MDKLNSVGDFIRSVFSTRINKDDPLFKALLADTPESPGTLETILYDIEETRNTWCNTPNVYVQEGEMLEKTLSFFSVLSRAYNEDDRAFKERNKLLFIRNGDTLWGDRWNVIKLFQSYFQSEFVYVINDTDDKNNNLLRDGDFEEQNGVWKLESCQYSHDARFSERFGLKFANYGKCSQTVEVRPDATYFLHFFQNGNVNVEIQDNNGRYWKPAEPYVDEFGSWVSERHTVKVTGNPGKWEPKRIYFLTDQSVSSVTISFLGIDGQETHIDYTRLFKKEGYAAFTLLAVFGGRYTPDTLGMAPGTNDPITRWNYEGHGYYSAGKEDGGSDEGIIEVSDMYLDEKTPLAPWEEDRPEITVDYSKMSYIEQSHLFGVEGNQRESLYAELLEIVQAGGIPSYIEILIRELDE